MRTLFGDGGLLSLLVSGNCALFPSQRRGYVTLQIQSAPKSFIIRWRQKPPNILWRTLLILLVTCIPAFIRPLLAQQPIQILQPSPIADRDSIGLDPVLVQANTLLQQNRPTDAEPLLREYLAHHPNSPDAHFLLGSVFFRQIQEGAYAAQSSAVLLKEEKAKASLAEFTAGARFGKPGASDLKIVALDYILLGDYRDADKWLTRMLEWAPNDSEGWYYLGRTKYNENRFDEAVHAFQQSLKLDPQNVKSEDNLGLAYAGLNRVNDAVAAYHSAIEWQRDASIKNPGPFINLADLLLDQNRSEEAIAYLLEAIQIVPQDSKAHELLGKAYVRLDQFPQAQAELEKAAQLAPQNANLPCMMGPMYRKQGLTEKAKLALERCAFLNGTHSSPENLRP